MDYSKLIGKKYSKSTPNNDFDQAIGKIRFWYHRDCYSFHLFHYDAGYWESVYDIERRVVTSDRTTTTHLEKELDTLATAELETQVFTDYNEQFQTFALLALLVLIIDFFIFNRML